MNDLVEMMLKKAKESLTNGEKTCFIPLPRIERRISRSEAIYMDARNSISTLRGNDRSVKASIEWRKTVRLFNAYARKHDIDVTLMGELSPLHLWKDGKDIYLQNLGRDWPFTEMRVNRDGFEIKKSHLFFKNWAHYSHWDWALCE